MVDTPAYPKRVLVKVGEIALKGRNRGRFYAALRRNLRAALKGLPGVRLVESGSVLVVGVPPHVAADDVCGRVERVFGISAYAVARRCERDVEDVADAALPLLTSSQPATFAVRVKRRDKSFPLTSNELEREIGTAVQARIDIPVDLTNPALTLRVELDRRYAYVATRQLRGPGGLPVGSTGAAICLLSGGIDSPIAALHAMKRGLHVDYIHFSGAPYVDAMAANKALALAKFLNGFSAYRPGRLWVARFGGQQRRLSTAIAPENRIVLYRRQMLRVADLLARRTGAEALVTGDSLGQVSSQTLANLAAVDGVAELPLLRPLITMDKREVMEEAARRGILRLSEMAADDACPLFADAPQQTRTSIEALEAAERKVDAEAMATELVDQLSPTEPGAYLGKLDPDARAA